MIARPFPFEAEPQPRTGSRSGRNAARRRRVRTNRLRYAPVAKIVAVAGGLTLFIVVYLALMANVTRLNYALQKELTTQARLLDRSSRLDDRIARLESRERLGEVAQKLGMREPDTFSQVVLPRPPVAPVTRGIAFLTWLR